MELKEEVPDSKGQVNNVWGTTVLFCAMRCTKNSLSLLGNREETESPETGEQEPKL